MVFCSSVIFCVFSTVNLDWRYVYLTDYFTYDAFRGQSRKLRTQCVTLHNMSLSTKTCIQLHRIPRVLVHTCTMSNIVLLCDRISVYVWKQLLFARFQTFCSLWWTELAESMGIGTDDVWIHKRWWNWPFPSMNTCLAGFVSLIELTTDFILPFGSSFVNPSAL